MIALNEVAVTDGLITILIILIFVLPVLLWYMVWDSKDKKRREQAKRILIQRKKEFKKECERAGQRMMNADKSKAIIESNVPKKEQTIKYTGLFSGENAPKE